MTTKTFELTEQELADLKIILDRVLNQQFVANTAPAHRLREKILDHQAIAKTGKIPSPESLDFWATTKVQKWGTNFR